MDIKVVFDFFRTYIQSFIDILSRDLFTYGNSNVHFSFLHALVGGVLLCSIIRLFWKGA